MKKVIKAFKTQIYPDTKTRQYFKRCFGVRRVVWNRMLAEFFRIKKETGRYPHHFDMYNKYVEMIHSEDKDSSFEWLASLQFSGRIWKECIKDITESFAKIHEQERREHRPFGSLKPHFKKRKHPTQSFAVYQGANHMKTAKADSAHAFSLATPRKNTRIVFRTAESVAWLMDTSKVIITRVTITLKAGKYYMSVGYEKLNQTDKSYDLHGKIGIDLGVKKSTVSFDGTDERVVHFNTDRSRRYDALAKVNDYKMSRMKEGSHRYEKLKLLKDRRYLRAERIRKARLEEYTTFVASNYSEAVIDDFTFRSFSNKKDRKERYRCMVFEFKTRLEQKATITGCNVRYISHHKGVKTTRLCHACGSPRVKITEKGRQIICPDCGLVCDRDINAAHNCYKL